MIKTAMFCFDVFRFTLVVIQLGKYLNASFFGIPDSLTCWLLGVKGMQRDVKPQNMTFAKVEKGRAPLIGSVYTNK